MKYKGSWTLFWHEWPFRRDLDVISRPPESTIDFLSFYIGFGSYGRVKIVVLDEHIAFV